MNQNKNRKQQTTCLLQPSNPLYHTPQWVLWTLLSWTSKMHMHKLHTRKGTSPKSQAAFPRIHKMHKVAKEQLPEWMQHYQASTATGWGHEPRIPHLKPSGGDQPDKKQSHQEPNTKGTENHQKPNQDKWEPRAKETYVLPEKTKENHLSLDTFTEQFTKTKHIPVIAKTPWWYISNKTSNHENHQKQNEPRND